MINNNTIELMSAQMHIRYRARSNWKHRRCSTHTTSSASTGNTMPATASSGTMTYRNKDAGSSKLYQPIIYNITACFVKIFSHDLQEQSIIYNHQRQCFQQIH